MYELFSNPSRVLGGQIVIPRFIDVQKRIIEDVNHIVSYYRHGTSFSRTDHLLVRLITMVNTPLDYSLDRYYEVACARALPAANALRLTSSINVGQFFKGIFYHQCDELIIAYVGDDLPGELAKDWRNLKPVKVLECPVSNLWYMLPNGHPHNTEEGLAVIGIDIGMLMIQYRGFALEQQAKMARGEGSLLGMRDFVGKYVIPNMLYSQTDLAIINRIMNLHSGAPMGDSIRRHPFRVSNYTELLDKGLEEGLRKIDAKMRYRDMLEQIPSVFNDYPLGMPDLAETRQVWWALFLTRLKAISFLFDVAGEKGRQYNAVELNTLKRDIKMFKSDNVFKSVLPPDRFYDVSYELDRMFKEL